MSGNRAQRRGAGRTPPPLGGRYGSGRERRALAPAVVAVLVLLAGLLLVGQEAYVLVLFLVAILSVITAVFVVQAKQWAWLPVPLVVAVLWNPILPFSFSGTPFRLGHVVAAAALLLAGAFARTRP